MKRQRAEISSNVISHIKSAHPAEMWRSDKLGIKEKSKSREIPSTYFFRTLYRPVCPIGHIVYL